MRWILENDVFSEGLESLHAAIDNAGHERRTVKHKQFFSSYLDNPLDVYDYGYDDADEPTIFYGSINLSRAVRSTQAFNPGVWFNENMFRCAAYYPVFGEWLLNDEYVILPLVEAIRQKDWLFQKFGEDDCVFVRPNDGDKPFKGQILPYEDFNLRGFQYGFYFDNDTLLVLVSRPKVIHEEYRLFTDSESIICSGSYQAERRKTTGLILPDDGFKFAMKVLQSINFNPDPIYTLDIASTSEGWKVMEVGCFSSSGLYGCNPEPLVKRVEELSINNWK